jgi:hypothetical protein
MGQRCRCAGFPFESGNEVWVLGQAGMHDFESNYAVESEITREIHRCHATAGNDGLNAVALIERVTNE